MEQSGYILIWDSNLGFLNLNMVPVYHYVIFLLEKLSEEPGMIGSVQTVNGL